MGVIRKKPLFEIYIENNYLVINNSDYAKDNGRFKIDNILDVELIQNLSFLNKLIEVTFGLNVPAKSNEFRINLENGFKEIVLTNCDIKNVEKLVYEINQLITNKKNMNPQ